MVAVGCYYDCEKDEYGADTFPVVAVVGFVEEFEYHGKFDGDEARFDFLVSNGECVDSIRGIKEDYHYHSFTVCKLADLDQTKMDLRPVAKETAIYKEKMKQEEKEAKAKKVTV